MQLRQSVAIVQAETSDNVQQCDLDIYLRKREASACRIFSTVHLPLFIDATRSRAIAVLEITQFKGSNSNYQAVFNWSRQYVQVVSSHHHQEMQPASHSVWAMESNYMSFVKSCQKSLTTDQEPFSPMSISYVCLHVWYRQAQYQSI